MKRCNQCVMDTTDPEITFDDKGICSHCLFFAKNVASYWQPGSESANKQCTQIIERIKEAQKDQPYDVLIGLSGGVDSSYLAYWAVKQAHLRVLALHVDTGWDSEVAVQNIERLVKGLGIELYTEVVDWEAMRQVQLAFFKAGVAKQDTPQDHAIFGIEYLFARKHNVRFLFSGRNIATESILPRVWGHDHMDAVLLRDICRKYNVTALKQFPYVSFYRYFIDFPYFSGIQTYTPLDLISYTKKEAIATLSQEFGWKSYGAKHYESRLTKFIQSYWLLEKFGYDKRKPHLSSLILSGQITREEALEELQKPAFDDTTIEQDIAYVAKKLEISSKEFLELMREPNRSYLDFKHYTFRKTCLNRIIYCLSKVPGLKKILRFMGSSSP